MAALAALASVLPAFLLGASDRGAEQVTGVRAGGLDAGSIIGAQIGLERGQSYTIGQAIIHNTGKVPASVEAVEPQSSSRALTATPGRIWLIPSGAHWFLPSGWPGWPPKRLPRSSVRVFGHRSLLSLPVSQTIPPGRAAQLVFGISLHANPSSKIRITALTISFQQAGHKYSWRLPEPVFFYGKH